MPPDDLPRHCVQLPQPVDGSLGALVRAYLATIENYRTCAGAVKGWAEWADSLPG